MSRWKAVLLFAFAGLLATVWAGGAFSAQGRPGAAGGAAGGQQRRRFDPEQMRQAMLERMKESLGATDEEWKVLGPKVEKVQTLSRQVGGGGGMGGLFGGRGRRATTRPEGAEETRQLSAVEKAVEELRATLENEQAQPEEIKKKLTALREAREKAKQELDKAQEALREIVTLRQEAQLVLMGLLD